MFTVILFSFLITSNIFSCEALAIIRYIFQSYDVDYFSYTDVAICGTEEQQGPWCNGKNAWIVNEGIKKFGHRCTCQCFGSNKTFLIEKGVCVNELYLGNHYNFGPHGNYFFGTNNINLNSASTLVTNKKCKRCVVYKVMYSTKTLWHTISFDMTQPWEINRQGVLTWPETNIKNANGKILKIELKNCLQSNGKICSSWGTKDPLVFCKSIGNYSVIINSTTTYSLPTTLAPTSSLIKSESQMIMRTVMPVITQHISTSTISLISPTSDSVIIYSTTTYSLPITLAPTPSLIKSESQMIMRTVMPVITQHISTSTISLISPTSAIKAHYPTTAFPSGKSHIGVEDPTPIAAIVGSVAGVVVIGIIVFCIVWKLHKEKPRERPRDNPKVPPDFTGNPMYGKNQGDVIALPHRQSQDALGSGDGEYDYATVDGGRSDHQKPSTPIYQSLIKDNVGSSVYDPLNKVATTPMGYSYNHLQHPRFNPPRSMSDPLYNTLEIPDDDEYLEPETQIIDNPTGVSEPVYNVLEGPDANSAPHDDDPVYNVLEDPNANQDNDPVYNVLEGPDDDYDNAPIDDDQNIPASGQDNVAYSSTINLNIPHSPSSPDYDVLEGPEGALPDSTYQPLSIRVQDDVYQPLDRASQSIYQTLEPNDSKA